MSLPTPRERWFFALLPDEAVRDAAVERAARLRARHHPDGCALNPARYHLTLRYLGEFAPVPGWLEAAARTAGNRVRFDAFDWTLDYAGRFTGSRVWWLGSRRWPQPLLDLRDRLEHAMAATTNRWPSDHHRFHPHLTIQRDVSATVDENVVPISWRVDELVLIRSRPPAHYEVIARWPAAAAKNTAPGG